MFPSKVIVADPNEDTQYVFFMMLEHAGLAPLLASNGQEALELAGTTDPAAIILDVSLRTSDGRGLLQALRASHMTRSTPIIALRDLHGASSERDAREDECTVVFGSPVAPSRVIAAVKEAIAKGREPQPVGRTESAWERALRSLED